MGRSERLVGRAHVRDVVDVALHEARSGAGQLVLISGEAGIGKSAVLSWLVERATPSCRVLRGFCWDGNGVPPYWPWTQVLRATDLTPAALEEAGWLVGAGEPAGPGDALAAADARFRLFDAVARSLVAVADLADGPLVVVLDDLHWADEPSLTLLSFVTRFVATSPVLLVGAYRDDEASPSLLQLATEARHIPLPGLSSTEVDTMVEAIAGERPPPSLATRIRQRSGGNPLFVGELTRLLQAEGTSRAPSHLPAGVIETVRRRLARLSTDCVRLLDWAAVAGRDIDTSLLARSGAVDDEATALDTLRPARQAGLITGTDTLHFTHDLYRDAIIEGQAAATNTSINLALGRALQTQAHPGGASRVAAHLLAAGSEARHDAVEQCLRAAREATARLGHDDACTHYGRALALLDDGDPARGGLLLELAAAHERTGMTDPARRRYREAADLSRSSDNAVTLAQAALGMQSLGHRTGAQNAEIVHLLHDATRRLELTGGPPVLRSRVLAATTRAMRHSSYTEPDSDLAQPAHRAVELAAGAGDPAALAAAQLAVHDAIWAPGTAASRLTVTTDMLAAARAAGDADLIAQAHLLRATALLELGDPDGRGELLTYITLAGDLGHARGRWGALTRQATFAQLAGRAEEAARLGEQALDLGRAIGEPDALGCFCTHRWSLVALGVPEPEPGTGLDIADPLWPIFPLLSAWPPAARGDSGAARTLLGDFSVLDVTTSTGLEALAVAAVVFAAAGTSEQRRWTYEQLRPHAGTHVIVGGCAAYHAAVDHHLGMLAAACGDDAAAEAHLRSALAMHQRLGAAGWTRLSEQALADLRARTATVNEFRDAEGRWLITYAGRHIQLRDAKGLHDLWVILGQKGAPVHVLTLLDPGTALGLAGLGADPMLDARATAEYRRHLDLLARQIDDADGLGRTERADQLRTERDILVHELAAAAGLGGRSRPLGDQVERARKTISARVRDSLNKIEALHPLLARHLREAVHMGTTCSYAPREPTAWRLR